MTDNWTDRLSEYLDGTLAERERAALETHLAGCRECSATLAELRQVVARGRALEDRAPAADLWSGIAGRIGLSAGVTSLAARRARRLSFTLPQLAAAASVLLLLGSGGAYLALHRATAGSIVRVRETATADRTVRPATWAVHARASQDSAVAELRAALEASRRNGRLDTATVRVIEQSLATIDSAIVQAQRALAGDPSSAFLNQHLAETLRRKSQFLRRASSLVTPRAL